MNLTQHWHLLTFWIIFNSKFKPIINRNILVGLTRYVHWKKLQGGKQVEETGKKLCGFDFHRRETGSAKRFVFLLFVFVCLYVWGAVNAKSFVSGRNVFLIQSMYFYWLLTIFNFHFFRHFLLILCGFHILHPNPTHLLIPSYPPSVLATSSSSKKVKFKRKLKNQNKLT